MANRTVCSLLSGTVLALTCLAPGAAAQPAASPPHWTLERTIPLGMVAGRIDHLAVDPARQLLFVAELGNGSVSEVDLAAGTVMERVTGLAEPQGVLFFAPTDTLYVANGGDGTLVALALIDFDVTITLPIGPDADNIHLVGGRDVAVGFADGLAFVDPATNRLIHSIPLSGHAEGFAFNPEGTRGYVSVPDADQLSLVDVQAGTVLAEWPAEGSGAAFPMALDGDRILVAARAPASLDAYSTDGRYLASAPLCDDSDDLFADPARALVYVVCGEGTLATYARESDGYRLLDETPTSPGARTGLYVPELDRLFVAARANGASEAAILVFAPTTPAP